MGDLGGKHFPNTLLNPRSIKKLLKNLILNPTPRIFHRANCHELSLRLHCLYVLLQRLNPID
jgi:hypothetical protein